LQTVLDYVIGLEEVSVVESSADLLLESLVLKAQSGDKAAFSRLYESYRKPVSSLIWFVAGPDAVEDLTQDVFMKAYLAIRTLQQPERFNPWLMQIARNHCKEWPSKQSIRSPAMPLDDLVDVMVNYTVDKTVSVSLDAAALRVDMVDVMKKIPVEFRLPLYLHYCRELSIPEVALAINATVATAKWRVHRALEICRLLMLTKRSEKYV
jgi:RNA polymerase sigma-70 factor (ECF subfamily)